MTEPVDDAANTIESSESQPDSVTHVIDIPADVTSDVTVETTPEPLPITAPDETDLAPDSPAAGEIESEVTTQEPVIVASDSIPGKVEPTVETKVEAPLPPDTRPKRKLGWRAFILGGSGGTK